MSDNKDKIQAYKLIIYFLFFISMKFKMEKFLGRFIFKNKLIILLPLSGARLETAADHQKYSTEDLRQGFCSIQTEQLNMRFKGTIRVSSIIKWQCLIYNATLETYLIKNVEGTIVFLTRRGLFQCLINKKFPSYFRIEAANENRQFKETKILISNTDLVRHRF